MPSIRVSLPSNRSYYGQLTLLDDQGITLSGPFAVLGRADAKTAADQGNPGRSTILPYGDTPTGDFRVDGFQQAGDQDDIQRHGPYGKIKLTPISGEAKLAKDNGRTGLQIHGGVLSSAGALRPTNGCLRLTNDDMLTLLTAIITSTTPPSTCSVSQIDTQIGGPSPGSDGVDDGDPPADPEPVTAMPNLP